MEPNSLLAESSIHFLPSGGWALGTPVSKSEKHKLTKIIGVLQRSIPTPQYSYSVLWPQPVTETSACHLSRWLSTAVLSHTSTWSQEHQPAICTLKLAYWAVLPTPQQSEHKCSMWKMIQALIQRNPREGGDEDETKPSVRSSFLKLDDGSTKLVTFLYFLHLKKKTQKPCGLSMLFSTFSETS